MLNISHFVDEHALLVIFTRDEPFFSTDVSKMCTVVLCGE